MIEYTPMSAEELSEIQKHESRIAPPLGYHLIADLKFWRKRWAEEYMAMMKRSLGMGWEKNPPPEFLEATKILEEKP